VEPHVETYDELIAPGAQGEPAACVGKSGGISQRGARLPRSSTGSSASSINSACTPPSPDKEVAEAEGYRNLNRRRKQNTVSSHLYKKGTKQGKINDRKISPKIKNSMLVLPPFQKVSL
jgi:hypothetical protein